MSSKADKIHARPSWGATTHAPAKRADDGKPVLVARRRARAGVAPKTQRRTAPGGMAGQGRRAWYSLLIILERFALSVNSRARLLGRRTPSVSSPVGFRLRLPFPAFLPSLVPPSLRLLSLSLSVEAGNAADGLGKRPLERQRGREI